MERVTIEEMGDRGSGGELGRQKLSETLGTTDVALNYYRIEPEEQLPAGLHAHMDQEEVFVVLDGTAVFERYATESTPAEAADDAEVEVTVESGEAVRFAPGEFQSGKNGGDDDLQVLALGAPKGTDDVRIPITCPDCGRGDLRLLTGKTGVEFVCPDCGAERVPEPCPDYGGDLRMALDDSGAAVADCTNCEAELDDPPLRP